MEPPLGLGFLFFCGRTAISHSMCSPLDNSEIRAVSEVWMGPFSLSTYIIVCASKCYILGWKPVVFLVLSVTGRISMANSGVWHQKALGSSSSLVFLSNELIFLSMSSLLFCLIPHLVWNSSGENRGPCYCALWAKMNTI